MSQQFFGAKRPAAILKHAILRNYLPVYVGKTGSTSKENRVAYIDAYAGPGNYEDGTEGSPAVAVDLATQVRVASGRIDAYFIEHDLDSAAALSSYIAGQGLDWPVRHGEVEEELPALLAQIDPAMSLFVFLDPFGLGVSLELIGTILERSPEIRYGYRLEGAATEVLLNFSFPGLRRNAGHLTSRSDDPVYATKTRFTFIDKLNATLGGDWWQDIWASEHPEREQMILNGYLEKLQNLPGRYGWWSVPVSNRWRGAPLYSLVQLSQHPDGHWEFHEALSKANEVYRAACLDGAMDLEPLEYREAQWVAEIEANLRRILAEGRAFRVQDRMKDVFGSSLGLARTTHLRTAIKNLHRAGGTPTTGVGKKLQQMLIAPPTQGSLGI